jgi:dTDP-4-dehydrorhamnose 3,5-epimerase
LKIESTGISDVKIVHAVRHGDERGFFSEVFKRSVFADHGLPTEWVQDNHSRSGQRKVIRGLHFQSPPFAQAKLVRVTRGSILDIAVDLRRSSPTFGRHIAIELSAENWLQLYVPVGFAHGFCTLTEDTEVQYKVTAPFAPACEFGVLWEDPEIAVAWPFGDDAPLLSAKDRRLPLLRDLPAYFA